MPKYKKRDPEYTAVQFTGSNIREVMDELGPDFRTYHMLDLKDAESFLVYKGSEPIPILRGWWIVVDRDEDTWETYSPSAFNLLFEPVKRAGRPPKDKK